MPIDPSNKVSVRKYANDRGSVVFAVVINIAIEDTRISRQLCCGMVDCDTHAGSYASDVGIVSSTLAFLWDRGEERYHNLFGILLECHLG